VQRTVESKLQDMVSVKDFGAVGDGVTDDTAAIQAALASVLSSQRRGTVFLPPGTYRTTSTITLNGVGVRLAGETAEKSSIIYADFITTEVIRVKDRYSGVSNIEITASPTRQAAADGHGIRVEANDVQFFRPTHCVYENLVIRNQPGTGIYVVGACWFSKFENLQIFSNNGHGLLFENGETSGRTWKENPGIVRIVNCVIHSNVGNGILIGDTNSISNRGFRFQLENVDLYANAEIAGVRKSADQMWAFFDSSSIDASAFDGYNASKTAIVTRGLIIGGRGITISNSRFLNVTQVARVDTFNSYLSSGVTISNCTVFDSGGLMVLDPAVSIANDVLNVKVALNTTTEVYAPVEINQEIPLIKDCNVVALVSDFTVNNTITPTTALSIPLLNKQRVQFRAVCYYTGDAAADTRFTFVVPSGAAIRWGPSSGTRISGGDTIELQDAIIGSGTVISYGSSTNTRIVEFVGSVETNGTAGDLELQFAQGTQVATDTNLLKNSHLMAWI
jgi:hypothetical protein